MQLIKIGHFEINADQILFIDKEEYGYAIVFPDNNIIEILNDSDAYIDLSMFITTARFYYGNGKANEESQIPESSETNQTTNEGV